MTNKNAHNIDKDPLSDRNDRTRMEKSGEMNPISGRHIAKEPIPGQFEGQERHDAEFLWEKSAGLQSEPNRYPTRKETELALQSVHKRLGWTQTKKTVFTRSQLIWISAAAVILIATGIGYLFSPISVTAPYGEQAVAELPDGSVMELNSGTTIRYSRLFGFRDREVSLDGEAFVTVSSGISRAEHQSDPSSGRSGNHNNNRQSDLPFIIRANNSVVEVTGTVFNIRSRSDDPGHETQVHVTSGSVSLYPAGNPDRNVILEAGSWSRWNEGMEVPMTPEPAALDEVAGWRENRFHFRNEPLGAILREIERRFDIRIQLEAEYAASEILTAHYIDPDQPEKIIEDICHVKGLKYSKTANGFRIFR